MKLWKAVYQDDSEGSGATQVFATSERKVRKLVAEAKPEIDNFQLYSVERIDVPTTAPELASWLNIYCSAG